MKIVIASPHPRNDATEAFVRQAMPAAEITRIRFPEELDAAMLEELKPDWVFFPHWSWIIPPAIHTRFRCVIFHMTDLPYGRGGSPLQNLIVRGHKVTKLSALRCVEGLDAGPVYRKRDLSLDGRAEDILQRSGKLIGEMIVDIATNDPEPHAQTGEPVAFTRRKPHQSNLELAQSDSIEQIYDHIRMLDGEGYPPAFLETERLVVEFRDASLEDRQLQATVTIRLKP